ncbi:unnamed protein product, partial [Mesorhabditis belari]|uniref:Arrestin C-terminal-like domain-containing protein n=1 Tax=Mesorhabditis belari TaxID=2138241 RepID=A0AAF3JA50_9BILA
MDPVKLELSVDDSLYAPGDYVTGTVRLNAPYDVPGDRLTIRFQGKASVWFQEYEKTQTYRAERNFVDESVELWRFVAAGELLGMHGKPSSSLNPNVSPMITSSTAKRFRFRVPFQAVTSFSYPNSPANVKYLIKTELSLFGDVLYASELQIPIVSPTSIPRALAEKKFLHQKTFSFAKNRSVEVECRIGKSIFTPVEKIPIELKITNRWKQSIKYVHVNIVRKLECEGALEKYPEVHLRNVYNHDCTGVGLPPSIPKIPINDSLTFRPDLNLPALTPTFAVDGLMKLDYYIKISIGRAHNFVIGEMKLPITIVTSICDTDLNENEENESDKENHLDRDVPLIDFSTPSPCNPFLNPFTVDLLA